MQAKQEPPFFDWHQQAIIEQLTTPLIQTRAGLAFTSVGHLFKFNLTKEFPATKGKKLFFNTVARELYCFLKGYNTRKKFHEHGLHIWDANMDKEETNSIGNVYGRAWRYWGSNMDQLQLAIDDLIRNPSTRRAVVTAWDPYAVHFQITPVPSCHCMFQFNIVGNTLYTDVYQRSADLFLGLPFDVAEYAILSRLVVNTIHSLTKPYINQEVLNYHVANLHLYKEHEAAAREEISGPAVISSPYINTFGATIDNFEYSACELLNYPVTKIIKAKMLV